MQINFTTDYRKLHDTGPNAIANVTGTDWKSFLDALQKKRGQVTTVPLNQLKKA